MPSSNASLILLDTPHIKVGKALYRPMMKVNARSCEHLGALNQAAIQR
jgi:hypothetical protein